MEGPVQIRLEGHDDEGVPNQTTKGGDRWSSPR